MPRRSPRAALALLAVAVAVPAFGACSDDAGSASVFCEELADNRDALLAPITSSEGIDATLTLYRRLGDLAPLTIEEEWDRLVTNLETADTVDPSDPESRQRAADSAYASEASAHAVAAWAIGTCGVDLGPVATIAPPPSPTTTTTVTTSTR